MIPTLLYLLYKRIRKQRNKGVSKSLLSFIFLRSNQVIFTLVVLLLLVSFALTAQKSTRSYKVMRNGNEVGWMNLEKKADSSTTTISMQSEVKIRFLFTFSSAAKEVSEFRDGKLQHSYYYRKTNGDIKADRHTRLAASNYEVANKSETTKLHISPVTYNTLCMYFQEPVSISKVYSDNHQRFLDIRKEADGGYTIVSPDGTSNSFYYSSGVCYKVKIDHSFYSAVVLLK